MATTPVPEPAIDRGHTVAIGDLEMYYEAHGAGTPLVLLHGFGGCGQNWQPFIAEFAARHRVIVVDLRGHGRSTNPDGTFTHRQAGRDVLRLLDALGLERFSAIGISTGAMALLHMATREPRRVESLILVSATSHFPEQARAIMRGASLATMPGPVREMYRACASRGDEQVRRLVSQFNALANDSDDMDFTAPTLSTITARTLVVHGDRDRFFPVEIAVNLRRCIPDATLWIIPGGEHAPLHELAPDFASTALRFIEGPGSPSQPPP